MKQPACPRHAPLDQLRAQTPVYRDDASASFILTRMDDVRALLSDNSLWRDPDKSEPGALVRQFKPASPDGEPDAGIGWMDDPHHARVRPPIQKALWKRAAAARAHIEALVGGLLDDLGGRTEFDVATAFAAPIPIAAMGHIFGIDTADFAHFRDWSEKALDVFRPGRTPQDKARSQEAIAATLDFLDTLMKTRRRAPGDDLISDLLAVQSEARLSDAEIRVNLLNLMLGGNLTTADLISSAVWLLLTHPAERAKLAADPALIGAAIEETLRFEPPTEGTQRIASRDLAIRGCPVKAGQVVAVFLHAANRDPEVFADPHCFDISRKGASHVAFGGGAHICIGAPLARLEAQVAVGRLLARFPNLRLVEPDAPAAWRSAPFFRGLDSLPVLT